MRPFWSRFAQVGATPDASSSTERVSPGLRVAATVLRIVFIGTVVLITIVVSLPQNETIWTVYDTPLDVVRVLLGLAVCIWLVVQLFKGPQDSHGYRTWLYLGLVAIPFTVICLVAIW
jgi:FtsH-binding integral membrane protein